MITILFFSRSRISTFRHRRSLYLARVGSRGTKTKQKEERTTIHGDETKSVMEWTMLYWLSDHLFQLYFVLKRKSAKRASYGTHVLFDPTLHNVSDKEIRLPSPLLSISNRLQHRAAKKKTHETKQNRQDNPYVQHPTTTTTTTTTTGFVSCLVSLRRH